MLSSFFNTHDKNTMDIQKNFTITEYDGPRTCLWKILQGKDWTATADMMEALKHTRYSRGTFATLLHSSKLDFIQKRDCVLPCGRVGREYCLIPDAPKPPRENVKITTKERQQRTGERPRFSTYHTTATCVAAGPWGTQ